MTTLNAVDKISPDGRINVVSPLDGRVVDRVETARAADLAALAARARGTQAAWAQLGLDGRAQMLKRLKREFAAAADDLVEILREEVGRHPAESWFAEIVPNIDLVTWWTGPGRKHLQAVKVGLNPISYPRKRARVVHVPRGVLGLITPWNYPVSIPLRALVPALLSGNAVLWKPSEYAALTAQRLGEVFQRVLPQDLLFVVQGDGRVGAALLDHVDGIGFTGSLRTGKAVAARAAERLIPASLELGGKDFAVVLADADLRRAAAGIAWAGLSNAGQNCAAVEVVAVDETIAAKFTELLREEVRQMAPFVGPVINALQKQKISGQLEDAVARGGLVLEGGSGSRAGLRVEPTLIERVPWDAALIREETFGPVLPVMTFRSLDEIAAQLDAGAYGLTLSVWTRDVERAARWGQGRPVGVVSINNHAFTAAIPPLPWTGVKGSGLGVTNGPHSLEWMVRPQGILEDRMGGRELWWHPFNAYAVQVARSMAMLTGGVGSKWAALKGLIGGMLRRWQ